MKPTMKAFREVLNARHAGTANHKHGQYQQRKRGYGDYLYFQDREQFDMLYAEWRHEQILAASAATRAKMQSLLATL